MTTDRIHNFSAGPAVLPEAVLRKAQEVIWNAAGSGIGIMEHSHRGKVFERIRDEAEESCRKLANIPDNYRVLFLQGGASLQFAMVPMNLLTPDRTADYLVTGVWSQKAVKEAKPVGKVHIAATSESTNFDRIPKPDEIRYSSSPAYVHITTDNTIFGTQWRNEPQVPDNVPLIADTSSDMYSRPIDIRKYGLIYAGAQKNLGPSGVVLVI
ncbi:MAG TPA: 3-phosphoserine/phosphohydroxythreonine transaminase, partial [Gemmatimonadales bacterium]